MRESRDERQPPRLANVDPELSAQLLQAFLQANEPVSRLYDRTVAVVLDSQRQRPARVRQDYAYFGRTAVAQCVGQPLLRTSQQRLGLRMSGTRTAESRSKITRGLGRPGSSARSA